MSTDTVLPLIVVLASTLGAAVFVLFRRPPGFHLWALLGGILGTGVAGTFGVLISGGVIENGRPAGFAMLGCLLLMPVSWATVQRDRRRIREVHEDLGSLPGGPTGPLN